MKFYFLHMNSNEVGTTLKHRETINGNVKRLSNRIKRKDKGNVNFKNLTLPLIASIFGQKIVTGLPKFSIEEHGVCRGCTLGKHAKAAFPSSKHRSKGILDIVHSDVCGLMSIASITGSKYYVSLYC
jgi:hypothetical protein